VQNKPNLHQLMSRQAISHAAHVSQRVAGARHRDVIAIEKFFSQKPNTGIYWASERRNPGEALAITNKKASDQEQEGRHKTGVLLYSDSKIQAITGPRFMRPKTTTPRGAAARRNSNGLISPNMRIDAKAQE